MTMKAKTALTWLIIALISVSGCGRRLREPGPGMHHGLEQGRPFRIYIYGDPTQAGQCLVDWPQATLWKSKQHAATWVSDDGAAYTVDFKTLGHNGSPFSQDTFPVPAGGEAPSGVPTHGPGYYDYGIKDANNKLCKPATDPGIYVK